MGISDLFFSSFAVTAYSDFSTMAAHMKQTEWDNIPEWAIYALEYGTEEDGSLNEEERAMIEKFIGTHFPKGYTMSVDWDACNEFDRYPAFGEPCKTCKVLFVSP
jgi:hypothetical protein